MTHYRCVNHFFGYCSTPPETASSPRHSSYTDTEYNAIGKCESDWHICPFFIHAGEVNLSPPPKASKRRTVVKK